MNGFSIKLPGSAMILIVIEADEIFKEMHLNHDHLPSYLLLSEIAAMTNDPKTTIQLHFIYFNTIFPFF